MWGTYAEALETIEDVPAGSRLWYDDREVALLQQDAADRADIVKTQALTIESLMRSGFTAVSSQQAVTSGSFEGLDHTGLVSVQLFEPDPDATPALPAGDDGEDSVET